jgi:bifunctional non-homologous end joining protein LigD
VSPDSSKVTVDVEGRTLTLSNLDKVLYPDAGFTKGEVIDYYTRVAPVLLTHLADRPVTVKRYPNGVDGPFFFEKNASRGTPDWVRTVSLPVPGSTMNRDRIDFIIVEELATLVWLANLAALELHTPQWHLPPRARKPRTDMLVFDLDPGAPADVTQCAEVAVLLRERLQRDGLTPIAKTSGSKGLQVNAAVTVTDPEQTSAYAQSIARDLEQAHPHLALSRMAKALRPGKIFIDWSQNNPAKTTVTPYSLRARAQPTVSTPLTWAEVERGTGLVFTAADVLARIAEHGDLYAPVLADSRRAPLPKSAQSPDR